MSIENKYKKITMSGKRKAAVSRATIIGGTGKIMINKRGIDVLDIFDRLKIEEPLRIAEKILGKLDFDVTIKSEGGGDKGQIDSARLALARAIIEFTKSKELAEAYLNYDRNLLVADVRRKEAYKPGDSKARSMRQASKR
jgi:small subunit ribosomal protein S9